MRENRCVLMSGRSLSGDKELCRALQNIAVVVKSSENRQVQAIMTKKKDVRGA